MKLIRVLLFILLFPLSTEAHPGIGLVYDGKHTMYYTDLVHIWKMDTNSGEASIFLENIHSHELWLDDNDTLYGEHYWYDESVQVFKHYIWMAKPDADFSKISETHVGENDHFSFVRESLNSSYRLTTGSSKFELIHINNDSTSILAKLDFIDPSWLYLTSDSNVFIVDYPSLHSISLKDSSITQWSEDLSYSSLPFSLQDNHHHIYGVWQDINSNIYVALFGGRKVVRIDSSLNQKTVIKTSFFWSPINGVFDSNNDLWLLEASMRGKVRLRKVALNG